MILPAEVQRICKQYLEQLQQGNLKGLSLEQTDTLYQAFGILQWWRGRQENIEPLWLTEASRVVSWLAIITARKVIFVWEAENLFPIEPKEFFKKMPVMVLETAEKFLLGEISEAETIGEYKADFYYLPFQIHKSITFKVYCALQASIAALETTLYGSANPFMGFDNFVDYCLIAFAGIDSNEEGVWLDYSEINQLGWDVVRDRYWTEDRIERVKNYKPVINDQQKELEFWEWWLTEAIPQAWELATTNHQDS